KRGKVPALEKINLQPLTQRERKTVHVVMFSELAKTEDIHTWLNQYCTVHHGTEVRDVDGIKTGARKFEVRLLPDNVNGGLRHLPSTIRLGACNGYVFYVGQPKVCRRCGAVGHLASSCTVKCCKTCGKQGHLASDCSMLPKCNLCGSEGHVFKNCPHAYANKLKMRKDEAVLVSAKPARKAKANNKSNKEPLLDKDSQPPARISSAVAPGPVEEKSTTSPQPQTAPDKHEGLKTPENSEDPSLTPASQNEGQCGAPRWSGSSEDTQDSAELLFSDFASATDVLLSSIQSITEDLQQLVGEGEEETGASAAPLSPQCSQELDLRKRKNDSVSSPSEEEREHGDGDSWNPSTPPSTHFLEMVSVNAFTAATLMKAHSEDGW
ncbi:ZCHC3 protein, partial [Atractosteus spatula]|nr:ZCHC3 protein [Atractosteus spatula]